MLGCSVIGNYHGENSGFTFDWHVTSGSVKMITTDIRVRGPNGEVGSCNGVTLENGINFRTDCLVKLSEKTGVPNGNWDVIIGSRPEATIGYILLQIGADFYITSDKQ
ncbi:hypothetical protein FOL47_010665 [Perkinsus chesapeaki]|uniref:Uncharacterized protein n=1 Tax=Perkinsus chesapeaki TaxID=330153 RepID=A0A7J6L0Q4_PERCH|nr:hypothetical protein FOL47_010665 [Perkinsus chesapeaki]